MGFRDTIENAWDKAAIIIGVPFGFAFIMLGIFEKFCLDKLPYLTC